MHTEQGVIPKEDEREIERRNMEIQVEIYGAAPMLHREQGTFSVEQMVEWERQEFGDSRPHARTRGKSKQAKYLCRTALLRPPPLRMIYETTRNLHFLCLAPLHHEARALWVLLAGHLQEAKQ